MEGYLFKKKKKIKLFSIINERKTTLEDDS